MSEHLLRQSRGYFTVLAAYAALWSDIFLGLPMPAAFSFLWFLAVISKNILRLLCLVWLSRWLGEEHAPWARELRMLPSPAVLRQSLRAALASLGIAGIGAVMLHYMKVSNPLFSSRLPLGPLAMLPLALLSGISVGYIEEAFFRFFMPLALVEAGIPMRSADLASILAFAAAHYAQGWYGIAFAACIALLYTRLREQGYGLHALALGHAAYDASILMLAAL
ncbi:MAG: CPBP family intramembrane metalloprotease [Spirochaetales bacterium]|nr:CPBP family intramembrane metalloprotease [Spirochaetales bacterium]